MHGPQRTWFSLLMPPKLQLVRRLLAQNLTVISGTATPQPGRIHKFENGKLVCSSGVRHLRQSASHHDCRPAGHWRYKEISRMDCYKATKTRSWIHSLALFLEIFNYSWVDEPPPAPLVWVLAETEGWQEEGGKLLCFLLQSLEKVKGKFSSAAAVQVRKHKVSVGCQTESAAGWFLTGQIWRSIVNMLHTVTCKRKKNC